jgi:hypothetical protein
MKILRELSQQEKTEFERMAANHPAIRDYLHSSLEAAKSQLIGLPTDSDFRFAQGQAQVLNKLVEAITNGKR